MNENLQIQSENRKKVFELFRYRCGLNPSHSADVIHEIVPKSLRPNDWWELDNMIPLCNACHEKIHQTGTRRWRSVLRKKRESVG